MADICPDPSPATTFQATNLFWSSSDPSKSWMGFSHSQSASITQAKLTQGPQKSFQARNQVFSLREIANMADRPTKSPTSRPNKTQL